LVIVIELENYNISSLYYTSKQSLRNLPLPILMGGGRLGQIPVIEKGRKPQPENRSPNPGLQVLVKLEVKLEIFFAYYDAGRRKR
jgi:hypothetical protein